SSGLSIRPRPASAARISATAIPRSPRRRLDITPPRWPFGYGRQRRRGWWPYVNYWGMNYWGTTGPWSQTTLEVPKTAGPVGRVSRSESVLDFAQQGRLALRSDDPLHRCAALEQNHRRDRDHLEIPGGLRVGIHVELGDLQRA